MSLPVADHLMPRLLAICVALTVVAGCQQNQPVAQDDEVAHPLANASAQAAGLHDVIETTPAYLIGISYPQAAAKYPPLADALQAYAAACRERLMRAVQALQGRKPAMPYDLSLQFSMVAETPRLVAVAASGSSYLGGAHGEPLEQRFVWLVAQQQMLAAEQLIPDAQGWRPVSDYVRGVLRDRMEQSLDEAGVQGEAREAARRLRMAMIEQGTQPDARHFALFEPVINADGSIRAIRFVFPPYQVGPYADGTQTVDVPARMLLPNVAPAYRALFGPAPRTRSQGSG
ncbi:RsiV family protein [Thermomonas hydrothermalis]|nr:RsiV family protein [Thermomonas hydrothermalis]